MFSARPGTPAYDLVRVDENEAKNRLIKFQSIAEEIKTGYRKNLINKTVNVLFENRWKKKIDILVEMNTFNAVLWDNQDLTGTTKKVKIIKGNQNTLYGEITLNLNHTNYAA